MLVIFDEQQKYIFHHSRDRVEQEYMGAITYKPKISKSPPVTYGDPRVVDL